jgi:predicted S18 family serine protease
MRKEKIDAFVFIIFILLLSAGIYIGYSIHPVIVSLPGQEGTKTNVLLPAVDERGNGVVVNMTVEVVPGSGKVLTDIDKILFWVDTQDSIQTAKHVAGKVLGIDKWNVDLIYSISSEEQGVVGGESAGAAITIASIFALRNQTLPKDVAITGTIDADGNIGIVGGIVQKARAVRDAGAKLFLIPKENIESVWKAVENCTKQDSRLFCEKRYVQQNITTVEGIEVVGVSNIYEALKYFNYTS